MTAKLYVSVLRDLLLCTAESELKIVAEKRLKDIEKVRDECNDRYMLLRQAYRYMLWVCEDEGRLAKFRSRFHSPTDSQTAS